MDQAHARADAGLCLCIAHEGIYTQQGFINPSRMRSTFWYDLA